MSKINIIPSEICNFFQKNARTRLWKSWNTSQGYWKDSSCVPKKGFVNKFQGRGRGNEECEGCGGAG